MNPLLGSKAYEAEPIDQDKFKIITPKEEITNKVAYVDGGNMALLKAPNFSVQLNRVYYALFDGNKRIQPKEIPQKIEFLSLTYSDTSTNNGNTKEIFYHTEIFPVKDEFAQFLPNSKDLSFNARDRSLTPSANHRADITRVETSPRKFAEWTVAKAIVDKELDENDIIVMDGTLQTGFPNESRIAADIFKQATAKGIIYTGLSKTCRFPTSKGQSLIGAVLKLEKLRFGTDIPLWFLPIAKSKDSRDKSVIYFVRLHPQARYIYRFDILKNQIEEFPEEDISPILWPLVKNSRDFTFLGYPYGLVDADHKSRVQKIDIAKYQITIQALMSRLKKEDREKFERHSSAITAHEHLNEIMF